MLFTPILKEISSVVTKIAKQQLEESETHIYKHMTLLIMTNAHLQLPQYKCFHLMTQCGEICGFMEKKMFVFLGEKILMKYYSKISIISTSMKKHRRNRKIISIFSRFALNFT